MKNQDFIDKLFKNLIERKFENFLQTKKIKKNIYLIKNDVHNLDVDQILSLTNVYKYHKIQSIFFFLPHYHPLYFKGKNNYKKIINLCLDRGHKIGIHLDAYYEISIGKKIIDTIYDFQNHCKIDIKYGNFHGNTKLKQLDNYSLDIIYNLIFETRRNICLNKKENVQSFIKNNQASLSKTSIEYWVDRWIYVKKNGFITSDYISDNYLKKNIIIYETVENNVNDLYCKNYPELVKHIKIKNYKIEKNDYLFDNMKYNNFLNILIHPQFYFN